MNSYALLSLFLLTLFLQNGFTTSIETPFNREIIGDSNVEKLANVPIGDELNRRKIRQKRENSPHLRHLKLVRPQHRNFELDHESKDRPMSESRYAAQSQFQDGRRRRSTTQADPKGLNMSISTTIKRRIQQPTLANFQRKASHERPIFVRKINDPKVRESYKNRRKVLKRRKVKRPNNLRSRKQPIKRNTTTTTDNPKTLFDQIIQEVPTTAKTTSKFVDVGNVFKSRQFTDLKTKASKPRRVAIRRTKLPQHKQHSLITQTTNKRKVISPLFRRVNKIPTTTQHPLTDYDYLEEYFDQLNNQFDFEFSNGNGNNLFETPSHTIQSKPVPAARPRGKQLFLGKLIPTPVQSAYSKEERKTTNRDVLAKPQKIHQHRSFIQPIANPVQDSHPPVVPVTIPNRRPSTERIPIATVKPAKISQSKPRKEIEYEYDYNSPNYDTYDYTDSSSYNDNPNGLDHFKYGFEVRAEETGNFQSRTEERDGKTVTGKYEVALPDGRIQLVTYIADENGFRADVSYTEQKNKSDSRSKSISDIPSRFVPVSKPSKRKFREKKPHISHKMLAKKPFIERGQQKSKRILPEFEDVQGKTFLKPSNRNKLTKEASSDIRREFSQSRERLIHEQNQSLGRSVDSRTQTKSFALPPIASPNINPFQKNINTGKSFDGGNFLRRKNPASSNTNIFNDRRKQFINEPNSHQFRAPPKPKPIPPLGHRQVAKIPPNPFQKKQSRSFHKPVQPSPEQISNINQHNSNIFRNEHKTFRNELKQNVFEKQIAPKVFSGHHTNILNGNDIRPSQQSRPKSFKKSSVFSKTATNFRANGESLNKNVFREANGKSLNKNIFRESNGNNIFRSISPSLIPPAIQRINFPNTNTGKSFKLTKGRLENRKHFGVENQQNVFQQPATVGNSRAAKSAQNIPIVFQYASNKGEVSPPLLYNPNIPIYVTSLGETHSIPLLLPIQNNHVSGKRSRRKPEIDMRISESELFLNRPDIYPQARRKF